MSAPVLDRYVGQLVKIFQSSTNKHLAHEQSHAVLGAMSADPAALTAIFRRHMERPETWNTGHYPVMGMSIALNPYFGLDANCWIPLPGGETNLSTKAIHHHGELLLTTATAFGPGYEHWTFHAPELIDAPGELYRLRLIERAAHPLHHVAFVDSYTPHLPMYPPSLSITLALWGTQKPTTWRDFLKRIPLLKRNEAMLKRLLKSLGATPLDLKIVEYFDFYPVEGGFRGMKERVEFARGPNDDYLHSLCHILQQTHNERLAPIVRRRLASGVRLENRALIERLLGDLESGRTISGRLSEGHYGVPHANFTADDINGSLAALDGVRSVAAGSV